MVFLPLQAVQCGIDDPGPIVEASDQSSSDMGWVVGLEVQVPVSGRQLPVDRDV